MRAKSLPIIGLIIVTVVLCLLVYVWVIKPNMSTNLADSKSDSQKTTISAESSSTENNSIANSSTVEWQPCSQPQFREWFAEYVDTMLLECAVIDVALTDNNTALTHSTALPTSADKAIHKNLSTNVATDQTANTSINNSTDELSSAEKSPPQTIIKLAISRLPASGTSDEKLGLLINVAGGPGQSSLDVSPTDTSAFRRLSKHFDIVGYAPRGVMPSTPTIACDTTEYELDNDETDDAQDFATACWEQTPNDLLQYLGADYAIEDIEAIRQAVAAPTVSLLSYSYGTKLTALYAEKYPTHLRAAVLDGVVDLNEPDMQMRFNQEASVQATFERFVDFCHTQPDCYFSDTKTLAEAEAKLGKIYRMIEAREEKDLDGERIYPNDLGWEISGLLMWQDQWEVLNTLLNELEVGDFELLNALIDYSKQDINKATFASISCADVAPNDSQKIAYLEQLKQINKVSTWDNFRPFRDDEILDSCYYWPVSGSDTTHIPKLPATAPTILLVAQTNDPATPYANAVAMQQYLNGILLTREGDGHTLVMSDLSHCVDKTVVDYLIAPEKFAHMSSKNLVCKD